METNTANYCKNLQGIICAEEIYLDLGEEIKSFQARFSSVSKPQIVYIVVGNNIESLTYVSQKERACKKIGAEFIGFHLDENTNFEAISNLIIQSNINPSVNGIIIQLPLPNHLDESSILDLISINKDIDCLSAQNIGRLAMKNREPSYVSCSPKACIHLLKLNNIVISGKRAVVIGRSNLVGLPLFLMLQKEDATVTLCHSNTQNLDEILSTADIIAIAIGKPEFLKGHMLKNDCVVLDIGFNVIPDNSERGFSIVGDVDYDSVISKVSHISPVPGGIGPMTVAMLMKNLVESWKRNSMINNKYV